MNSFLNMRLFLSKGPTVSVAARRKHSASQTESCENIASHTLELSPEQAFTDIDKEFEDRRHQSSPQANSSTLGTFFVNIYVS